MAKEENKNENYIDVDMITSEKFKDYELCVKCHYFDFLQFKCKNKKLKKFPFTGRTKDCRGFYRDVSKIQDQYCSKCKYWYEYSPEDGVKCHNSAMYKNEVKKGQYLGFYCEKRIFIDLNK